MRIDEIVENNKKIAQSSLKSETEIARATLSVLTDISETLAMFLDLTGNIYGREILTPKQIEQIRRKQALQKMGEANAQQQ
jgi:hypothetical protein